MPDRVILIAAVTVDGYIARHNLEITSWSQDLKLFKNQTMGCPVIMGSNTFKTLANELAGRENIVVSRKDNPRQVLSNIKTGKCFVIGGGKTYFRFLKYITDVFITPHPYVFGSGVPLFSGENIPEVRLDFERLLEVNKSRGIFQYQYKVKNIVE